MSFKDKIEDRMKFTWSEDIAVEYFKLKGLKYEKVGLDGKIDAQTRMSMPEVDRSKPDFKIYIDPPIYVEVKTGASGRSEYDINEGRTYPHFKFKINDFKAYLHWNKKRNTYLMIHWDFGKDGMIRKKVSILYMQRLIQNKNYKKFKYSNKNENNKEYYAIPMEDLNGKF
tara:strand:+ start:2517 stop:3026 length:510 start_codon:yes stop_codon:yes gene_type:complete